MISVLIEKDGSVSEDANAYGPFFIKPVIANLEFLDDGSDTPPNATIHKKVYELHTFDFSFDRNNYAVLAVYIDKEFLGKHKKRDNAIKRWIRRRAPYLFTYAERRKVNRERR